ncbi:MAG: hypothetical protein R2853_19975 [Thermomicrobiales bacterium]
MANQPDVRATLQALLLSAARAEGWLPLQRWYADKGRAIASSEVVALRLDPVSQGTLALVVAQFRFADGGQSRYFIPLFLAPTSAGVGPLLGEVQDVAVFDAVTQPWFGGWLLHALQEHDAGWLTDLGPAGVGLLDRAAMFEAQVLRGEQSNTSLRFGDAVIVKLFRRLQPGVNPDEEALRALSEQGFAHAPPFVGSLTWPSPDGAPFPLALATGFVPHQADGWSWLLARLGDVVAGHEIDMEPERLLGQRTAEMHLALAAAGDPAFEPDDATADDIGLNQSRTRAAIEQAAEIIQEREQAFSPAQREALPATLAALRRAADDVAGYQAELGLLRIRTHGDFHLGQTLRTEDDWVILDFEGEPARPVEERRRRASALKDVAGMLRSFAYARGAASQALPEGDRALADSRLLAWESAARAAFLSAYRQTLAKSRLPLVPAADDAFALALRAWELDKALYEIAYEARNRPTWLAIPLAALIST